MVSVTVRIIFDYYYYSGYRKFWMLKSGLLKWAHFFRNKTFLLVKIERWNFESFHEIKYPKDAENFSFLSWQPKHFCFLKKVWHIFLGTKLWFWNTYIQTLNNHACNDNLPNKYSILLFDGSIHSNYNLHLFGKWTLKI